MPKIDKFYHIASKPFHQIDITDFCSDVDEVLKLYGSFEDDQAQEDHVSYLNFLDYFRHKPLWEEHILNKKSSFMKLLKIEGIFYKSKELKRVEEAKEEELEVP